MSASEKEPPSSGAGLTAFCVVLAFLFGLSSGGCVEKYLRSAPLEAKAVELGAAEWLVNPKDGTTKFTWKEKLEKP